MDVLVVTLWLLGIIISHLLLRRVVEIDNMNKQLLQEREMPIENPINEISDEDLKKELLEYVESQEYKVEQPEFELPTPSVSMMANMNMRPIDTSNVVQEFKEERDLNSGSFGNLQAYEENGFATI